ncbi:MAG: Ig-like domain-containing protein [Paludibacteraceae bacterium]|nr:Ig-like domain-containing protein [Paludibacteraceae bacterium]
MCLAGCGTTPDPVKTLEGISLNKKSIELEVGQDFQLKVWYEPEEAEDTAPAVEWESTKTKVATVDENGKVYAKSEGKTTIVATCGKFTAECDVEVVPEPEPVAVESISLNETTLSLEEGQTFLLTVSYAPAESERTADAIEWSSNNESVATVTEGMVSAIAEGSTVITAKCGSKSAQCSLTVTKYTNEIKVSPATITFPSTGGKETVQVVSSTPWTATTDADWLTVSPDAGEGSLSVTVSVNANAKNTMLTASVTFANTENTTILQVTKEGKLMTFSAAAGKKVLFAPGNLEKTEEDTYRFAEPYSINENAYSAPVQLHNWKNGNWGSDIEISGYAAGTWRMFSYAEITYIVEQRANADKLRGAATVGDQLGYVLLPDEWETPDGMSFTANSMRPGDNVYTTKQWSEMAAAGAAFFAYTAYDSYNGAPYCSSTSDGTGDSKKLFGFWVTSATTARPGHTIGDLYYQLSMMMYDGGYSHYYIRLIREVE